MSDAQAAATDDRDDIEQLDGMEPGMGDDGVTAAAVEAGMNTEDVGAEAVEADDADQPDDDDVDEPADPIGRLEREGDIAADYLEELLDIADLDGDIDLDVENDRAMVSIVGSDLTDLVGPRGATLDALQDLTRLAVLRATGERSRLMLDIGGTRAKRRTELHRIGTDAAGRARAAGEPVRLDPMTPFERKVVHDAVAAAGLRSESDGLEPNRRVVVYPS